MKILFINISDIRGGASIIAYNLAKYFELNFKTQNILLVRDKITNDSNVIQTRGSGIEAFIERTFNIFMNVVGLQYKFLPFSPRTILKTAENFRPDIINLHNPIGGYFRISDMVQLSNIAPIVWTLHDMWPMTGNAAHTFENEQWKKLKTGPGEKKIYPWIGLNTGTWLLKEKKRIYSRSRLRVIVPSSWMYEKAKQSPVFEKVRINLVHHGIDLNLFRPFNKIDIRTRLNIPSEKKVIMYSAEKLSRNQFKGGIEFSEIILKLDRLLNEKVVMLGIGKGELPVRESLKNIEVRNTGYVFDKNELISYYSASDIFIYPTKADSFGLVLLEAIACGTPCITFNLGGCSDIIEEGISGFLIPPSNTSLFAERINYLLSNPDLLNSLSQSCRKYAESKFSLEEMATEYFNIFNEESG